MSRPAAKPAGVSKWRSKALEERIARADAASADIKSFNEYVNNHGFSGVVVLDIPGETKEKLMWQQLGPGTWGLSFHCDVQTAGGKARKVTPLIECTMPVRLRMAKLLPRMLIEIDRCVMNQESVTQDESLMEDD